jgi:methyl-accepting chemotaxis protein
MAVRSFARDTGTPGHTSGGALGACLLSGGVLLLAAIAAFLALPASGWPRILPLVLALFALACILGAWFLYARRLLPAIGKLAEIGESTKDNIENLSAGIAKLSTGDIAATVILPSAPAALPEDGALAGLAKVMGKIAAGARECIDGFDEITNEPCLRTFYVGSDSFEEGLVAGEAIGRLLKGKGRLCVVVGDERSINYRLRAKGVASRLAEKYPGIALVETRQSHESGEATYAAVSGLLEKYRNLECVYVAEGKTPQFAARAVVDAGRAGKTAVVGHDTTDDTMELVAQGVIGATISQDPYAQGYDAVIRLYNCIATGWKPTVPRFLTAIETVTAENCSRFWSRDSGAVYSDRGRLASPAGARGAGHRGRIRIAVVSTSGEGFWRPTRKGVMDARDEIARLGAEVEWITPPPELENDRATSTFAPIIERLAREGWQGVAIPVFDRSLVPYVNRAVHAGVAVGTFNSEPVSLRELVSAVKIHAGSLIDLSQELAASAEESGQSTRRIGATMDKIGESLETQLRDVSKTNDEIQTLIANIRKANETTEEGARSARGVASTSAEVFKSVSEMGKTVKSLEEASSAADSMIRSLKEDTDKIGAIVAAISDISNQTNVLAINASIQAARAGGLGKGFAVIAAEIRKLADQSNHSTREIADLISLVQGRVVAAGEATARGLERARENSAHAEFSEKSLRDISALAGENMRSMEIIHSAVEAIASFSGRVQETVRSLKATNQRSEDASVEVRSSTQEMAAQAAEVANAAQALSQMAKDQQVILSQFRIDNG